MGIGIALRGQALANVIPNFSSMSKSMGAMPPSSFHWNEFNKDPNITGTVLTARGNPGQILLPAPNGMSSKSCPLTSISKFQNLSGLKTNGFSQMLGSRPIAHTLTRICESLGIVYSHRFTSCSTLRGIKNGTGGCILNVSFTTHCKENSVGQQIEGSPESCTPNIHRFTYLAALLAVDYKLLDLFSPQLLVDLHPVAGKDVGIHDYEGLSTWRQQGEKQQRIGNDCVSTRDGVCFRANEGFRTPAMEMAPAADSCLYCFFSLLINTGSKPRPTILLPKCSGNPLTFSHPQIWEC
nr:RNA polymerase, subunit H/Rpb5, conserved site-containing protein [Ipomoea batatas]